MFEQLRLRKKEEAGIRATRPITLILVRHRLRLIPREVNMGAVENIKDIADLVKKFNDIELNRRILNLENEVLDLSTGQAARGRAD